MQPTFQFDESRIQTIVDRLPANDKARFPQHIFEPIRIEIAHELVLKEFYKLFPLQDPPLYERMSADILRWLGGAGYELAPVADFWNYCDGMMLTLKLKNIIPAVTSANVHWKLEQLDPRKLHLRAPIGNLAEMGKPPYSYEFINERILQNAQQMIINRRISDEKSADTTVSRDHYPVVVQRALNGEFTLLDGNRRTLRALLYGRPTIDAWVGTVIEEPRLKDQWVSTGIMYRLLAQYEDNPSPGVKTSVQSQLVSILDGSQVARINYKERCVPHFDFAEEFAAGHLDI